jgi:hypothetical protein
MLKLNVTEMLKLKQSNCLVSTSDGVLETAVSAQGRLETGFSQVFILYKYMNEFQFSISVQGSLQTGFSYVVLMSLFCDVTSVYKYMNECIGHGSVSNPQCLGLATLLSRSRTLIVLVLARSRKIIDSITYQLSTQLTHNSTICAKFSV